ncbi:aminoglycoside 3 -phosphotransferase choline kinase protein [Fusarium flagelliforme]|uniref:Aminoglycoside 3-phosphotransferase choline kinase protein n=1 Tax=Fusarium flagelliforme TaxID=2675880 RepID=A0A395MMB7_9HYPO|nr:aminoglycoside 3 -phosphotransferase choline kinase protein [Fusarium flagelliforme]
MSPPPSDGALQPAPEPAAHPLPVAQSAAELIAEIAAQPAAQPAQPAVHGEIMNPARAQMLAQVAQGTTSPSPPPDPKIEEERRVGPLKSGANCSELGDPSWRISRASQQPEDSRAASVFRSDVSLSRPRKTINFARLPKRPSSMLIKEEDDVKEKKPKLSSRYYTDIQSLGPAPRPDEHTRYLTSLLRNRKLFLTVQRLPKKQDDLIEPKTYEFRISQAGLVQHEKFSIIAHTRALPLAPQGPADGNISQTVVGELLEDVWPNLSRHEKYQYARQLRNILQKLRCNDRGTSNGSFGSVQAGPYSLIVDNHPSHTYYAVRVRPSQEEFMALLTSTLYSSVPKKVGKALVKQFRKDYPCVLTHGDLCPRNIIVSNHTITWILGWDCAGHYPVWWEYARFFEARTSEGNSDWYEYADEIFADEYPAELAAYQGIARCQQP